mgnify:CR=1 FL=1|jgi:hypothetical protein
MEMKMAFKPRLILVADKRGDILYPVRLMRDELGLSQRDFYRKQATRETIPREVTPKARALPKRIGWIARLIGWLA